MHGLDRLQEALDVRSWARTPAAPDPLWRNRRGRNLSAESSRHVLAVEPSVFTKTIRLKNMKRVGVPHAPLRKNNKVWKHQDPRRGTAAASQTTGGC